MENLCKENALLKVKNTQYGKEFITLGGMEDIILEFHNSVIPHDRIRFSPWREMTSHGGDRFLRLTAKGVTLGHDAKQNMYQRAMENTLWMCQICFVDGDFIEGPFHVVEYTRQASYETRESFEIMLESAGKITCGNMYKEDK